VDAIQTPPLPLYPVPPGRRFSCFCKKKMKKRPIQNFVRDLFPHRGKCCGFVQEFRTEGKIHFVVALAVSLATSVGSDL